MLNKIKDIVFNHHVAAISAIVYATLIGPYFLMSHSLSKQFLGVFFTLVVGAQAFQATRVFLRKEKKAGRHW